MLVRLSGFAMSSFSEVWLDRVGWRNLQSACLHLLVAASDPLFHNLRKLLVLVLVREMAAMLEHVQLAPLQSLTETFCVVDQQQLVLVTPKNEDRFVDLGELGIHRCRDSRGTS